MNYKHTFRIDDISINTNLGRLETLVGIIRQHCQTLNIELELILAISPLVYDMRSESPKDQERAFPRLFSALSDYRRFYEVHRAGLPDLGSLIPYTPASHGLIHTDHRLLTTETQELSILTSCHLIKARLFVPPFNKWDLSTEYLCRKHGVTLIKFEDGWKHITYNPYDKRHEKYYLHTHDTNEEYLKAWLNGR